MIQPYQPQSDALEKVAAYCRVSTDSKDQLNSYRTQIGYYTNFIAQHPGWELVDIYADEGITGTSLEKRDEFKRMLQDCRAGKISRILVKSVSRFARNTLELIETIGVSYQPAVPARPYCPHLCFEADDMDEVLTVLRKHGIPILDGPNEIPGSEQWIYFTDPDGNVLEYIVWLDKHKSETP